jgi:hypothetical protein
MERLKYNKINMKLNDTVKLVFTNDTGDKVELDITVEQLLNKTTDDFYDMLEGKVPCRSASCNNESQNFCDCGCAYEDYTITEVLVEPKRMTYCVEVDRSGICEENCILHYDFTTEPTREDILKLIHEEDMGYDDKYCEFSYYKV